MVRSVLVSLSFAALFSATCWAAKPHHRHAAAAPTAAPAARPRHARGVRTGGGGNGHSEPAQVDARAYIVVDYQTGKVLAASDATRTHGAGQPHQADDGLHRVSGAAAGKLKLEDQVTVSEHAWRSEGSRTFIELGKPVSVERPDPRHDRAVGQRCHDRIGRTHRRHRGDLCAAHECERQALGHGRNAFREQLRPALAAPLHHRARHVVAGHRHDPRLSRSTTNTYSVREFEHNGIKQQNRNGLLEKDPSVDGLKTGHTDSAGFCLVTSAHCATACAGVGGARLQQHEGARERERRAAQLRLHLLRHQAGRQGRRRSSPPRMSGRRPTHRRCWASRMISTSRCRAAQSATSRPAVDVAAQADRAARTGRECRQPCTCSPATQTLATVRVASADKRSPPAAGGGA